MNVNHTEVLVALKTCRRLWGKLHDVISDMVESGKISKSDFPDDYDAIVNALLGGNIADMQAEKALTNVALANSDARQ